MYRLFASLLIALTPGLGLAQSAANAAATPYIVNPNSAYANNATSRQLLVDQLLHLRSDGLISPGTAQSTPLWSTPDGRIVAMVAFADNGIPTVPKSPQINTATDWQLVDVTNFISSGLLLNLGNSMAAHVSLSQGAVLGPAYLTPGCSQTGAFGMDNSSCARGNALAHLGVVRVGTDWSALDNFDVDLNYGLSWLRRDSFAAATGQRIASDVFSAIGNTDFPTLLIPGLESTNMQNSSLGALGRWHLNDLQTLDLGASLSRIQLYTTNDTPLTSLNQAALSVGLHYGSFSGALVGHVLEPADPMAGTQRWSGLDIGFSWRTPWQGQLSVGAQNLWSSGAIPALADPAAHEADSIQARVPYVRYHQDL